MKKICFVLVAAFQLLFLLNSCNHAPKVELLDDLMSFTPSEYSDQIKSTALKVLTNENDYLEMYVEGKTAAVTVKEKRNGKEWRTNPLGAESDTSSNGDGYAMMNSQVGITFANEKDVFQTYYSNSDAITYNQYTFEKIENGIKVNYILGKQIKVYLIPPSITKKRMDSFLNKLNDEEKEQVLSLYSLVTLKGVEESAKKELIRQNPALKNDDVYIVLGLNTSTKESIVPEFVQQILEPLFKKCGYNKKDLEQDYEENGLAYPENNNAVFKLAIEYRLEGKDLKVTIPYKEIEYNSDKYKLTDISVLPYFGAAGSSEKGYIFVPDGSGALMYLNNGKTNFAPYTKMLYGADHAVNQGSMVQGDSTQCYLPIFGLKKESDAFISIIEKGDALAVIKADVGGRYNEYNNVSANFKLTPYFTGSAKTMSNSAIVTTYQKNIMQSDIQLRYIFLENENANYSGMAQAYKNYLMANNAINKIQVSSENIPFNVNLVGAINHKTTVLGIPTVKTLPLTTYSEAQQITSELTQKNIKNIKLVYSGWANGGLSNTAFRKVSLTKRLGNVKSFNSLKKYLEDNNVELYPNAEMLYVSDEPLIKNYNKNQESARNISGSIQKERPYNLATLDIDKKQSARYLVSPLKYDSFSEEFLKNIKDYGIKSLALNSAGTDLNSDFNKSKQIDRQESLQRVKTMAEKISQYYPISSSGVNAYMLGAVSNITNLTFYSGNNYILDQSVPFYQIVLHGIIPYSSTPINKSTNIEEFSLKMIETGTYPNFEWMFSDNSDLSDTKFPAHSLDYKAWIDLAEQVYQKIDNALKGCQNSQITEHLEIQQGFFRIKYDNGTIIYVNYGSQSVKADGIEVKGGDYIVVGN